MATPRAYSTSFCCLMPWSNSQPYKMLVLIILWILHCGLHGIHSFEVKLECMKLHAWTVIAGPICKWPAHNKPMPSQHPVELLLTTPCIHFMGEGSKGDTHVPSENCCLYHTLQDIQSCLHAYIQCILHQQKRKYSWFRRSLEYTCMHTHITGIHIPYIPTACTNCNSTHTHTNSIHRVM